MARRRRWLRRILLGLLGLIVVVVAAVLVVAANLEWGPVKRLVQSQARSQGLEIDYDQAGATLGGVKVRNLRLLSPPADAALAPALVTIGRIDGRWSLLSKRVDELVVRDVEVVVVVDDDGTTSLDRLLAQMPKRERPPPEPLSRLPSVLPEGIAANARIEGVAATLVPRGKGEKMRLTGIAAAAQLGAGKLAAQVGPNELKLLVGEREGVARLGGTVEMERAGRLRAALELALIRQNIAPELPKIAKVVDLAAAAEFLPAEKRTHVRLEKLSLLDGAATLTVDADLHDAEAGAVRPTVHSAACQVDLVALARAVPPEMGPLAIDADPIRCSAKDLELAPLRGQLEVTGAIRRLAWQEREVRGLDLNLTARQEGDLFRVEARLPIESVAQPGLFASGIDAQLAAQMPRSGWPIALRGTVTVAKVTLPEQRAQGARLALSGTVHGPRTLDLEARIDADRVEGPATVDKTHVDVKLAHLVLADVPLQSTGAVSVRGRIASAQVPRGPRASDVTFDLEAQLGGRTPSRASLTADVKKLTVPALGPELAGRPAHLSLTSRRLELDVVDPARSRGEAKLSASHGGVSVEGTVSGSAAAASWDLSAKADRIGPARKLALATRGEMGQQIEQETKVEVDRLTTAAASVRGLDLQIASSGTLRRHQAKISAAFAGASARDRQLGAAKIDAVASVDLDRPHLDLQLTGDKPQVDVHVTADVDRSRTVRWEARGKVSRLGPLAALLPAGLDWEKARIDLKGKGSASGVIRGVKDGVPILAPDPLTTARGKQSLQLALRDIHFRGEGETRADVSALDLRAEVELGEARHAVIDLDIPAATAVASGATIEASGFSAHLDASQARDGEVDAQLSVTAKSARQSVFAAYPVRDAELTVSVTGDPRVTLSLSAILKNAGAGTGLNVAGELEQTAEPAENAVFGRHSLTLDGRIEQSLDALDGAPDVVRAKGRVTIPFRVESGDLSLYRTTARVRLEDVQLELPQQKVRVATVRGEIPVVQEILLSPSGTLQVGIGQRGVYPQLRFADHLPYLGTADYLSVAEVRIGERVFGPIAGNMRLDRDVFSVDQLEMSALGGKISGQCLVVVAGKDTRLAFRGKVTGIRPSTGEDRLDANAAVTLVPYRLGLEGRVEMVRIGKDHLYDLLDLWDPYHAEVSANRVRLGLKFGYPKQVRLHFLRGFASFAVELGGLAGAVRIDEIRGIPIGPALARWLSPILEKQK